MQLSSEDQRDDNKQLFQNWDMVQSMEHKDAHWKRAEGAQKVLVLLPIKLGGSDDDWNEMRPSVSYKNVELADALSHVLQHLMIKKKFFFFFLVRYGSHSLLRPITLNRFSSELRPFLIMTINNKPQTKRNYLINWQLAAIYTWKQTFTYTI